MRWKKIPDFEGYSASEGGAIRNDKTGLLLSARNTKTGYRQSNLRIEGKVKTCLVHCLVASAFIGKKKNGFFVDHIDRNKSNNSVANLRYVTRRENARNRSISEKSLGVDFHKASGLWRARCRENNVRKSLGYFKTKEEAIKIYEDYVRGNFGA